MRRRVKKKEELIKWFGENGYSEKNQSYLVEIGLLEYGFTKSMFRLCGKERDFEVCGHNSFYDFEDTKDGACFLKEWLEPEDEQNNKEKTVGFSKMNKKQLLETVKKQAVELATNGLNSAEINLLRKQRNEALATVDRLKLDASNANIIISEHSQLNRIFSDKIMALKEKLVRMEEDCKNDVLSQIDRLSPEITELKWKLQRADDFILENMVYRED